MLQASVGVYTQSIDRECGSRTIYTLRIRSRLYSAYMSIINDRIVARTKRMSLSQAELAKRLGMTIGQVSHYLTGTRQPSLKALRALAKALECSTDYLLGLKEAKEPQEPIPTIVMPIP